MEASDLNSAAIDSLEKDIQRMLRMFYLEMRVKGLLHEQKDDYFA